MSFMRRCVQLSTLGVLLVLTAGCHHDDPVGGAGAVEENTPGHSGAPSAVESRLNDPKISQQEKDQIKQHMSPGGGK